MDLVIGGKFKLGRKIGSGSFGEIYLGMHCINFSFFDFLTFCYCKLYLNNLDLFVSGVNVQTQEEVAVKLVSEVVMDSCCMFWSFYDSRCYIFVF